MVIVVVTYYTLILKILWNFRDEVVDFSLRNQTFHKVFKVRSEVSLLSWNHEFPPPPPQIFSFKMTPVNHFSITFCYIGSSSNIYTMPMIYLNWYFQFLSLSYNESFSPTTPWKKCQFCGFELSPLKNQTVDCFYFSHIMIIILLFII